MDKMDQMILAVPAKSIQGVISKTLSNGGFYPFENNQEYLELLSDSFRSRRGDLEIDPSNKQIIPYLVIKHQDKILYYIRSQASGEKRLHNKAAIGVGGHIQIEDIDDAEETILAALKREVLEEFGNMNINNIQPKGYIYMEISEVDKVHIGVLFTADAADETITLPEDEIERAEFIEPILLNQKIKSGELDAENWTKVLLDKAPF